MHQNLDSLNLFKQLKEEETYKFFKKTNYSFSHAIEYWSKALIYMLSISDTAEQRIVFINNLYDEHGNNDIKHSHVNTFIALLNSISVNKLSHEMVKCHISYENITLPFIRELDYTLKNNTFDYNCGVMGMIEYMYISVSKEMYEHLKNYMDTVIHYELHEVLDETHSEDLFKLIVDDDEGKAGIAKGYKLLCMLYKQ